MAFLYFLFLFILLWKGSEADVWSLFLEVQCHYIRWGIRFHLFWPQIRSGFLVVFRIRCGTLSVHCLLPRHSPLCCKYPCINLIAIRGNCNHRMADCTFLINFSFLVLGESECAFVTNMWQETMQLSTEKRTCNNQTAPFQSTRLQLVQIFLNLKLSIYNQEKTFRYMWCLDDQRNRLKCVCSL